MTEPIVNVDADSRTIEYMGEINGSSVSKLLWTFRKILIQDDKNEETQKDFERKPIHFHINSYGGSVYDGDALISLILASKTPIYTYCDGYCMSMGLSIYLAGHKRFCGEYAYFMYHQISSGTWGTVTDMKEDVAQTDRLNDRLMWYVTNRTSISLDRLKDICTKKQDLYFSREEAIECGIVTEK